MRIIYDHLRDPAAADYGYDANGYPKVIKDAKNNETTCQYDSRGNVQEITDVKSKTSTYTYDVFGLPLTGKIPKDQAAEKYIETPAPVYDANDNVTEATAPNGAVATNTYDAADQLIATYAPKDSDTSAERKTTFEYDLIGNQIKVITPRGVETTTEGDFTHEKVYDELNRVKEVIYPRDPASENPRYTATHKMIYEYDEVGNVTKVSAPPSEGQTRRNDTITEYFDNGWVKKSSDMWGISTVYDYNDIGKQISRTISGAGGTTPRTMSWDYFPDGKLKARSDTGSPAGSQAVVVDNVETQDISTVGTWATSTSGSGYEGDNHQYNAAGTGADTFTWNIAIPEAGAYNVYAKYVQGDNRITDAEYTITHKDGTATVTKNQQQNGGTWILLGKYNFDQSGSVKLSDKTVAHSGQTGFVVSADAVKVEKDLTGIPDNESKDFQYNYDVNGNMTSMTDNSPHAGIKTYAMTYSVLNQVDKVEEKDE